MSFARCAPNYECSFHPKARGELAHIIDYYVDISSDLADRFLANLDHGRDQIVSSPITWPSISGDLRRYILRDFPYQVIYRIRDAEIEIIALAHHKQQAGYWRDRTGD